MHRIIATIVILFSFLCLRCSILCDDCSREMEDTKQRYGEPEEINRYDDEGYHSVDWWYWSKGIEFTFTWGNYVDGCDVSTYSFTPIESVPRNYQK